MVRQTTSIGRRKQWLLLGTALLLLGVLLTLSLQYERDRLTGEQFQRLSTKARVIDANIVRQLGGVSETLKAILTDGTVSLTPGVDKLAPEPYLKALSDATLGVRTFSVMDPSGRVLASSRGGLVGADFSSREYFATPMADPDPDVLYLSQRFKTLLGVYSMNLVRVATNAEGNVELLATATLDPDFFSVLLSSVRFDEDVWVTLAHADGSVVLHYPEKPEVLGMNLRAPGTLFNQHMASGQSDSVFGGRSTTTGTDAWMAQRTIAAPELNMRGAMVIAVAREPAQGLAPLRFLVRVGATIWFVVALASAIALLMFQRYQTHEMRLIERADALRRKAEKEVRQLAFFDPLTGLPNRRLLMDRMTQLLAASIRHQRHSALLFLDLDGFKQLNDTLGHDQGDRLLQETAKRLQAQLRQEDTAARWAGDEFAVALSELSSDPAEAGRRAELVAQKILVALGQAYDLNGHSYQCTASIGVAIFGQTEETIDAVFKRADEAMYQAKSTGRNTYRLA